MYENNKSAAPAIKSQIKKELQVWDGSLYSEDTSTRYIEINSALVSAQNRQRFYVHNCGDVQQPADRGILLKDILESDTTWKDNCPALDANYYKATNGTAPLQPSQSSRRMVVAEPVSIGYRNRRQEDGTLFRKYETSGEQKANCLTTVQTDSMVACPVRVGDLPNSRGEIGGSQATRIYSTEGKSVNLVANGGGQGAKTGLYAVPVTPTKVGEIENGGQGYRIYYADGKAIALTAQSDGIGSNTGLYAIPNCDAKNTPIYLVQNGRITIKGKEYPIKLTDGYYIIRKLSVTECCRLQTLPDDYCRAVSNSQAYKGLGNGWTAEVIIHILNGALANVPRDEEILVLSMYDGIGTGRYCLEKMGFKNIKYYAYEIDKYAMQIATSNFPDIIECGDAYKLREDNWKLM